MKNNTNMIIVRTLENMDDVSKAISLEEFELTEEVVKEIAKRVLNQALLMEDKTKKEEIYNEFKEIVIRKAHNKNEYKKYLSCYKENANYKQTEETRQKEKENLIESRQALTALLSDLNEKLQEEVPGKKLIKEINFKKES